MTVSIQHAGQAVIASVDGSIDALTAPDLTRELLAQIEAGQVRVVVNLEGVEYVSSAGLRTLLRALKGARRSGGDVRLAGLQPSVRHVLELSGFTSILELYESSTEAVASYGA